MLLRGLIGPGSLWGLPFSDTRANYRLKTMAQTRLDGFRLTLWTTRARCA